MLSLTKTYISSMLSSVDEWQLSGLGSLGRQLSQVGSMINLVLSRQCVAYGVVVVFVKCSDLVFMVQYFKECYEQVVSSPLYMMLLVVRTDHQWWRGLVGVTIASRKWILVYWLLRVVAICI